MSPIIELVNVKKDYRLGGIVVPALRDVNLVVQPGELTAVMGPSGSGKSTLLNILGCLDRVTSGSYQLEGVEVGLTDFDDLAEIRNEKIGFIFQSFNLIPVLDALENIELPCLLRARPEPRAELRTRAKRIAEEVGLGSVMHHRPDELSGGQRQRVAIARALVTRPRLVLADEPTANLDSETSAQILALMLALNREHGVTFLFSTHDPRVEKHARRRLEISDGTLHTERADGASAAVA